MEKVRLYKVRINSGGYDDSGTYWGVGQPLYCCEVPDGVDIHIYQYVRANSREDAKEALLKQYPQLEFYR